MKQRHFFGLGLAIVLLNISPLVAEENAPALVPMGQEAFQVLKQFYEYDRDIPLEARIVDKKDRPTVNLEKIAFRGVRDDRVPALLAIPKTGTPPYPCVLLMHGLGGSKYNRYGPMVEKLPAAGFAGLALDAHGGPHLVDRTQLAHGLTWPEKPRVSTRQLRGPLELDDGLSILPHLHIGGPQIEMGS